MIKLKLILVLFAFYSINCFSQPCSKTYKWAGCKQHIRNYEIYQHPKITAVAIRDTLIYNVVFYGNRDYIISFCADKLYYPLSIKLLKPETREEIYDNAIDNYPESIGVGFYKTQALIFEVVLMSDKMDRDKLSVNDSICIGMIMNSKKIFSKIE